jgi:hypothetical protein
MCYKVLMSDSEQPGRGDAPELRPNLGDTAWDQIVAEGRITPGVSNLADLGQPASAGTDRPLSEILQEMRDEEI